MRLALILALLLSACDGPHPVTSSPVSDAASSTSDLQIRVGRPTLLYGKALSFPVEVQNKGSRTFQVVDLQCSLRTMFGEIIQPGHVFFSNVQPGQTSAQQAIFMHSEGLLDCRVSHAIG